ncbi:Flp pilus assembly protein, ATPase CpaE [Hoeflea sp. IMCC20628]|uniref:AAA family ATPase n=1 Tax=Hoeflea sp. IMCC20628 TaxID=1620421 RepID=UPI00063AAE8E|nr:CpaE family protein [Hoeflea sp. IMCC20628]AKI02759.1 Flp pilus assembly protein, ATPase CpaE [Hoeflea sp. IMCC20628]
MTNLDYQLEQEQQPEQGENAQERGDFERVRPLPRISVHAFIESEGLAKTMERCSQDRRMAKVNLRINSGGVSAAANMFAGSPTPNLLILETRADAQTLMEELGELAGVCDPDTRVVVVGHVNDVSLYRELVRNGVSEYIVAPVSMADVIGVISTIFVDPDAAPLGRSIAFVGAKGGVGSSTLAHNCAWSISNLFSSEVILADMDLAFGTANLNFDNDPTQGIAEAVFSPDRLDEVFLDRLLTKCSEHLSMLAAPSMLDRTYDFDGGAFLPILDIIQRNAPVSILDVPHIWSDWTRKLLCAADEIVITATPDLANLRNTKNLFDTLRKLRPNDHPPMLILNQVGMAKRPEIAPDVFCDPLEIEPLAIIPFDAPLFGEAANSGRMIAESSAKSPIAESLAQIAHVVTGRAEAKKSKKAGLSSLMGLLGRK